MKNRFNFNDGDFGDFPEDLFDEGEGYEDYPENYDNPHPESDEVAQAIELEWRDLNQNILFNTIKSLENSWFWKFRSHASKMKMIEETYLLHQRLVALGDYQFTDYTKEEV